jgi:putative heme iron utilization protein
MTTDPLPEIAVARRLLAQTRSAALATLDSQGGPFASYVQICAGADGLPLMLLSRLAAHTRHFRLDPRASLLLVREPPETSEPTAAERLSLTGRVVAEHNPEAKRLFLTRHPGAASYAGFADFSMYRFEIEAGHLVAGFGRIAALTGSELIRPASQPIP